MNLTRMRTSCRISSLHIEVVAGIVLKVNSLPPSTIYRARACRNWALVHHSHTAVQDICSVSTLAWEQAPGTCGLANPPHQPTICARELFTHTAITSLRMIEGRCTHTQNLACCGACCAGQQAHSSLGIGDRRYSHWRPFILTWALAEMLWILDARLFGSTGDPRATSLGQPCCLSRTARAPQGPPEKPPDTWSRFLFH
jgi:hypothetical protein